MSENTMPSGESEPKIDAKRLINELDRRIEHWSKTQNDPYNVAHAVIVALHEVRGAVEEACK